MPKDIFFPEVIPQWVWDRDCVAFPALVDGKLVRCLITMEALNTHFQARLSEEDCLRAFEENKKVIHDMARKKILSGEYSPKGEIMIRSDDSGAVHEIQQMPFHEPSLNNSFLNAWQILDNIAGEKLKSVTSKWNIVPNPGGDWTCQLILQDKLSKAASSAIFTSNELKDAASLGVRLKLIRVWGDLLEARAREQHQQVQDLVGALKEG